MMNKALAPDVQVLIMAGGRGERLQPLTESRPKPLVSFGGVFRIVDFTLSNCLESDLRDVSLLTQYKRHDVHDYIRESWSGIWQEMTGRSIACLPPGDGGRYRGTADAVLQNIDRGPGSGEESLLILSGDHVYHMDYRAFLQSHIETGADLTMAAVEHRLSDATQFGVVETDAQGRVVGFEEKPERPRPMASRPAAAMVNMGVYACRKKVLVEALMSGRGARTGWDFGRDVIPWLIRSASVYAYNFRDKVNDAPRYWRDIGSIDSYYEASMDLVRPEMPFDPCARANGSSCLGRKRWQQLNALLCPDWAVTGSVLSPGVRIARQSSIESSVIMRGVSVGEGTRIRHAIVEEGVNIPGGLQIGFDRAEDSERYFVTASGVVVVTQERNQSHSAAAPIPASPLRTVAIACVA